MVKVSIYYPNKPDGRFDLDYYRKTHMPLSKKKLGEALRRVEIDVGLTGGLRNSTAPYVVACHLYFDSADAFYSAFAPHADELAGDIKNYTNVEPVIQISDVKEQGWIPS